MPRRIACGLLFVLGTIGCAARLRIPPETAEHPAHPDAPVSPAPALGRLELDHFDAAVAERPRGEDPQAPAVGPPHGPHGRAPAAPDPPIYVCPMHPEVVSPEPGRCRMCGMALVPPEEKE